VPAVRVGVVVVFAPRLVDGVLVSLIERAREQRMAAYRQSICRVKAQDYLLRRLNGVPEPVLLEARTVRAAMVAAAEAMVADLHWSDFEVLVDLIFARCGWQRTSRLGETMADVDIVMEQPTLAETASVQVKSRASQQDLCVHLSWFARSGLPRTFFVCHSPDGSLSTGDTRGAHLWTGPQLAEMAIKAGLFDWLMERVA
jgi:hypothetical protein